MKKSVEALLVVAAVVMALFIGRSFFARHPWSGAPKMDPALQPGSDVEPGAVTTGETRRAGSVTSLPMLKLSSSPKPVHRTPAVPPPTPAP